MARPVEGFITSQGKFFETEAEAELYEASYNLHQVTGTAVKELGVTGEIHVTKAVDAIIGYINKHADLITEYLRARAALEAGQAADGMDGQTAVDNTSDDTSVRDETDISVAADASAKADTKTTRKSSK